jgi:hypothetical protein
MWMPGYENTEETFNTRCQEGAAHRAHRRDRSGAQDDLVLADPVELICYTRRHRNSGHNIDYPLEKVVRT